MRIAGGSARGRRLQVPAGRTVRPTSDRIRQSLFNILAHAPALRSAAGPAPMGRSVLDAFAGSGALGLEALSRGALDATFLEIAEAARGALGANIRSIAPAEAEVLVMRRDACAPGPAPRPHDLVFLDPPTAVTWCRRPSPSSTLTAGSVATPSSLSNAPTKTN